MPQIKVVLLNGDDGELAGPVARHLLSRGVRVAWRRSGASGGTPAAEGAPPAPAVDPPQAPQWLALEGAAGEPIEAALAAAHSHFGRLDALVNLYSPSPLTDAQELRAHIVGLEATVEAGAEFMAAHDTPGIVVNQFFCTTLFADSPLASAASQSKNALLGLTRVACVRHGKRGVRVVGVLAGLLDLPGARAHASERVLAASTPIGRWITAEDLAATIAFLALDSGYISGQVLVLDGGMTSGINGV